MASRQGRGSAGASRVLAKLNTSLEAGNYYEAHQMYRTLYFRYTSQKKYDEVEKLLYDGAVKLRQHEKCGSAADLSKLYLDNLLTWEQKPIEEIIQKVVDLYWGIPKNLPDKDIYLSQALRWSSDKIYPQGHPRLHQLLAYGLWENGNFPESRHHFLYSCDGSGCGRMLADFHTDRGLKNEVDLFIVGTVLQYLCLKKHIPAAQALASCAENHAEVENRPPYKLPLMNFAWFLLLAIEKKQSITTFTTLVEKYNYSLKRDSSYMDYISKIGQHYFGVPPPQRAQSGGMFSGIFDSLMSAFNDDEDEDMPAPESRPQPSTSAGASKSMTSEDLD